MTENEPERKDGARQDLNEPGALRSAAILGIHTALGTTIFVLLGHYADQKRHTGVFWTIIGAVLGFIYGAHQVWKAIRALDGNIRSKKHGPPKGTLPQNYKHR